VSFLIAETFTRSLGKLSPVEPGSQRVRSSTKLGDYVTHE
jgi:hypothetical protein